MSNTPKTWRNKPLFRRQGDVRFKTGQEAAELLIGEAKRRDSHESEYIDSVTSTMQCLAPIFDRYPQYAFLAKQLMEPERFIQFRVAWIDDVGVNRNNRGYRIQYSSSLGPYTGPLHFGAHINSSVIKSLGFEAIFSNSLTNYHIGAAVGGSDLDTFNKSEAEIQRFCQSYMTELAKYVGPDYDEPSFGMGVGQKEIGYLYGQYKRVSARGVGRGEHRFLGGGHGDFFKAPGFGVAHFTNEMLQSRNDALEGKRCLIVGSGKVARALAEKLLQYGAIPLSFSDSGGFVYEADGIDLAKLETINKIKDERGARIGRYIIASATAQFNEPSNDIFDIPCDLCFPCGAMKQVDDEEVIKLADNGCMGVIEGGPSAVSCSARKLIKKRGLMFGPSTVTMTGTAIAESLGKKGGDDALKAECSRIYQEAVATAQEFNQRGDLVSGGNIAGFLRVANVMLSHGAV